MPPPTRGIVAAMSEWKRTACILCECNCGLEVQLGGDDGRHLVKLRGDKRAPVVAGLRVREAAPPRSLPARADRVTSAAAPPRRRDVRGDRLGHRDPRGRRALRRGSRHARRRHRSSITAAAGRGTTCPARTRPRPAACSAPLSLERARAGEDRRVLGRRSHDGQRDARRLRALRRRHVPRQEPVALALDPPRARDAEGDLADPARTLIVVDPRRTETAELADIHLAVRPGTDAWLLARSSSCSSRGPDRSRVPRRARRRRRARARCSPRSRGRRRRRVRARRLDRGAGPQGRAA